MAAERQRNETHLRWRSNARSSPSPSSWAARCDARTPRRSRRRTRARSTRAAQAIASPATRRSAAAAPCAPSANQSSNDSNRLIRIIREECAQRWSQGRRAWNMWNSIKKASIAHDYRQIWLEPHVAIFTLHRRLRSIAADKLNKT